MEPTIIAATLPDGTVGTVYSATLTANGTTPISWSVEGSLPDGLSLVGNAISGTPTAAGTFDFTVKAENSAGSDTKALSITIDESVLNVTVRPDIDFLTDLSNVVVFRGGQLNFVADVTVQGAVSKDVNWNLEGGNTSGTGVSQNGLLTVGNDETAESITVKATSTLDPSKSGSATLAMVNGNCSAGGTVTGVPAGTIVYIVIDLSQQGQNKAGGNTVIVIATTDANGNYSFNHLPAGVYTVHVVIPGYTSTPSKPITLGNGETKGNVNFTVKDGAITPNDMTGVSEIFAPNLKIYPNPFSDAVRITGAVETDNYPSNPFTGAVKTDNYPSLRITNVAGVTVHTQMIANLDETIRLEHLPAGMYFFTIEKDGQSKTIKAIKN
jgi:hypothetical protein